MKQKYNNTLFVCDMDGTLLDSRHEISGEKIEAMTDFVKGGGLFSLATGRSLHSVKIYANRLPINCPAILYNGAMIYDVMKDDIIYINNLNDNVEEIIDRLIEKFPGNGISLFHGDNIYYVQENEYLREHARRERYEPVICRPKDVPKPWIKALMAWEVDKLPGVEDFLKGENNGYRVVYSEKNFLEILNQDVSKGSALTILAERLQIPMGNVIAAGDNLNDVELIQNAGLGVAVANAHPDLKVIADYVCVSHEENVILDCISRYTAQCMVNRF